MKTLQIIAICIAISITILGVLKILYSKWNGNILSEGDYL